MVITKDTKLTDILKEYPWLIDEAVKIDDGFKVLKTPIGKMMLKNATIAELSGKAGVSDEEIIDKINELIEAHE